VEDVPLPGSELTRGGGGTAEGVTPAENAADVIRGAIPADVDDLLRALWRAGHAGYVVGGSLRDALLGRSADDWDLATDALPDETRDIFPDSAYENRFGTVAVRRGRDAYEITTFRSDHDYADFRRPHRVEFGASLEDDLARRDFTVNAIAWGAGAHPAGAGSAAGETSAPGTPEAGLVDPFGGVADVAARRLRAVGDPLERFEEDALRMVRAVRLASTLSFEIDPATLAAIEAKADLVGHLSGERIAAELGKLLAAPRPSVGLRLLQSTGILVHVSPELAGQPGVPQNKIDGEDLWDHTLRCVDAAPPNPIVRLAALVHDIGKPATRADGHFHGHETVGAEQARELFDRLREPRLVAERVTHLVRHHMFRYEPNWSDAAVRRFIAKVGAEAIDELFALRAADNIGSGLPADAEGLGELRRRVQAELERGPILDRSALVVDGDDLMRELGLGPGPRLGRLLDDLVERVIEDPGLNDPPTLILLARDLAGDEP
jgi:tRNA nucleotidyltransferase (CCA-adding enzyme)